MQVSGHLYWLVVPLQTVRFMVFIDRFAMVQEHVGYRWVLLGKVMVAPAGAGIAAAAKIVTCIPQAHRAAPHPLRQHPHLLPSPLPGTLTCQPECFAGPL